MQLWDEIGLQGGKGIEDGDDLKISGFAMHHILGHGSYSKVYSCRCQTGRRKLYAAKVVYFGDDNRLRWAAENEIDVLKHVGRHPHLIHLHSVTRPSHHVAAILDYIPGPSLFQGIVDWPFFNEQSARTVLKQIFSALQFCHSNKVVHRDVQPQNILWVSVPTLEDSGLIPHLKLIDFNLSRKITDTFMYVRPEGQTAYMAPECLQEPSLVTLVSDVWSVGVILFMILAGYPPFLDYNYNHLLLNIIEGNYVLPDTLWSHVSSSAKDILKKMMEKNFNERWSTNELLQHDWFFTCLDIDDVTWKAQSRLSLFLERKEEKRKSRSHQFILTLQERIPYVPEYLV